MPTADLSLRERAESAEWLLAEASDLIERITDPMLTEEAEALLESIRDHAESQEDPAP